MEMVPKKNYSNEKKKEKGKKYNNGMFLCEVHFPDER